MIDGHLDFSGVNGGSIEAQNLVVFDGEIDLSNTTLVSRFINLTVRSIGSNAALDLTNTGSCIVIDGFIDVPSGGNVVTPATGANFTFANIATTSVTILDTSMGTRLATDGVTLKSDGSGIEDYLDDAGGYSVPKSIFNSDGVVTASRLVDIPSGRNLNFRAFNTATLPTATGEGQLVLKEDLLFMACNVLNGAGGTISIKEIRITPASMLVTDSSGEIGLVYAADYSGNFTARSLVDKGYVDTSTVQSIAGGTNVNVAGTATVPIVNLDAAITGVSVNGVTLTTVGSATDFLNGTGAYTSPATIFNANGDVSATRVINAPLGRMLSFNCFDVDNFGNSNEEGFLQAISNKVSVGYLALDGAGGIDGLSQLVITPSSMLITDSINSVGLSYAVDYSANFTDRSIIDKGYSDLGHLARVESGAANLTSSGKPILAVTDSSAPRTVTIATSDIVEGNQFIVKDEDGNAATNMITVTTPTISVTSVASGTSGSDFLTSTAHGYAVNQRVVHAGFSDGTYNGLFTVTAIVSTTRYEVAAITFVATDTGTSNIAMDDKSSFTIGVNYGSVEFYCNDNQVFTRGSSNTAQVLAERNSTTGLLEGGDMSIVGGLPSSTLNIGASIGQIVNHTNPLVPIVTPVSVAANSSYSITGSSDGVYAIAIDTAGTISEILVEDITIDDLHNLIIIGAYVFSVSGAVRILNEPLNVGYGGGTCAADFSHSIGPMNVTQNEITANGANLSIDNSGGTTWIIGQNFRQSTGVPHIRTIPQVTQISFRRSYRTASGELALDAGGATFTVIDPSRYDDGSGTLQTVSANDFTVQVLYITPSGIYNVAFGQAIFNSLSDAETAIRNNTLDFNEIESFLEQVPAVFIIVRNNATDLTDASQAKFIQTDKHRLVVPT